MPLTRTLLAFTIVAGVVAVSCGAGSLTPSGPPHHHAVPPDVHGEPLALLPAMPLLTLRIEAAELRRSSHWVASRELLRANIAAELATADRELGFDPLETADVAALGLYAPPPDAHAGAQQNAWPMLYVRGRIDPAAVLATARARIAPGDAVVEHRDGAFHWYASRDRAYVFPAPDVVIMFEPRLTGRLARQLSGEVETSAARDTRFAALEANVGGWGGAVRLEADTATLRRLGELGRAPPQVDGVERLVARADAPGDVTVRVALEATSEAAAGQLVDTVDALRAQALGQFAVRVLLGLGRLLEQGLTAVHEGRVVRVGLEARSDEVTRLLHASRLLPMLR